MVDSLMIILPVAILLGFLSGLGTGGTGPATLQKP